MNKSFNPRTPCGVRHARGTALPCELEFQSTHSLWSATGRPAPLLPRNNRFNPRTPCGVRPLHTGGNAGRRRRFNPRTPCGVRQKILFLLQFLKKFQSTHSLWSATFHFYGGSPQKSVSIHALLVECDANGRTGNRAGTGFNPRTPCGVRPATGKNRNRKKCFNPRTPCGVRPTYWLKFG